MEKITVPKEIFEKLYKSTSTMQQGGKVVTNSMMLTNQFIADEGQGNTNLESDEFVKRVDTGEVQQVVGEPHIKDGKKADGVDATLNDGDKVLSTYTKIPPKDVKELKERYQLSLRKNATFADAQKAYDKKLGITKITDELAEYIEKLGKNESTKDETAKRLNESVLVKEIEEYKGKLDELKQPQSMVFEDLFNRQEALPKRGDGTQIFDKNGKEVKEEGGEKEVYQQGGNVGLEELAKKHGISVERAQELVKMQEGGEMTQEQPDQMQQIFQAVAQMLQSGATPEQIAQQLVSAGVPQEAIAQIIQQVAQQMQGQSPQEGSMSNPQEEQMEVAQQGGQKYMQEAGEWKYNVTTGKNEYRTNTRAGQRSVAGKAYGIIEPEKALQFLYNNFPDIVSTKFKDNIDVDKQGNITFKKNIPFDKEQEIVGEAQQALDSRMKNSADVILNNTDKFSPEQVKEAQRYKEEETFLEGDSLSKDASTSIRGYDKKIGDFTSGRYSLGLDLVTPQDQQKLMGAGIKTLKQLKDSPLLKELSPESKKRVENISGLIGDKDADFAINEFITPEGQVAPTNITPIPDAPLNIPQERTETVMPWLPQALRLAPSSLDSIYKSQIALPRQEPIKATTEPMLAEQERARQTDVARVQASGLSPQAQEALLAQGLATSQLSSNDAIAKVENYNAQNQFATDTFNIGQRSKEDITNENFAQDYQNKVFGALNAQESSWKNYYQQNYLDQNQKFKDIENVNLLNAQNSNYQYIPGQGVKFLNNKSANFSNPNLEKAIGDLTLEEQNEYTKNYLTGMSRENALIKAKQKYGTK